jgi:hypothetical protein
LKILVEYKYQFKKKSHRSLAQLIQTREDMYKIIFGMRKRTSCIDTAEIKII